MWPSRITYKPLSSCVDSIVLSDSLVFTTNITWAAAHEQEKVDFNVRVAQPYDPVCMYTLVSEPPVGASVFATVME